ncbi:MAG: uracil-DNA glycosylase [Oscillospiraceae bacterium]|jgi:hypothetical protein|nr:uracil-DNA glycosylase [Oscillospiraceae bacterium]
MKEENGSKVNCFQCVHFVITWDPKYPRACKLFGFKSARVPSVSVHEDSGFACLGFAKKAAKKANGK